MWTLGHALTLKLAVLLCTSIQAFNCPLCVLLTVAAALSTVLI